MASCEKCWDEAYLRTFENPMKSQSEHYSDLVNERKDNQCTPEQQAGEDADRCPKCKRKSIHRYVRVCMNCGYKQLKK